MQNQNKSLLQAILQVRMATSEVFKRGTNTFHNYNYATANDVIKEVRDHMNTHQIIVFPTECKDIIYHKEGTVEEYTQIFTVCHAGSGESMNVSIRCAGEDKGDKKAYKSNTGALKYLLIQLFLLATDDDPENDTKGQNKNRNTGTNGNANGNGQQQQAPRQQQPNNGQQQQQQTAQRQWLNKNTQQWSDAVAYLAGGGTMEAILKKYKVNTADQGILTQDAFNLQNQPA